MGLEKLEALGFGLVDFVGIAVAVLGLAFIALHYFVLGPRADRRREAKLADLKAQLLDTFRR